MTYTRDLIIKLKAVRNEKNLSLTDILELMEKNGDFLSKSTVSRVFADGSETQSFKYEETIRPLAKALLDIETIEDDDNLDTQAMKLLLQYKIQRIEELESLLAKEKIKYHEKLDKERSQHQKSIEFLKGQIELKDKRMDHKDEYIGQLTEAIFQKDKRIVELTDHILHCPYRKECHS